LDKSEGEKTVKTLLAVLLLSALSYGQTTPTEAQLKALARDCSTATKVFQKKASGRKLSQHDFEALANTLRRACGLPEEYAAVEQPAVEPSPRDVSATEPPPAAPISQAVPDMHELLAQHTTGLNREIALGNRLIAHLEKAQTWEGIDADHPEAVALREKIAQEEEEFVAGVRADIALADKLDLPRALKGCSADEISRYTRLVTEATATDQEASTQQERYHALGY
jgi:hypothetical protein